MITLAKHKTYLPIQGTFTEMQILQLLEQPRTYIEIAGQLGCSLYLVRRVAQRHPELGRGNERGIILRKILRGGWTETYIDRMRPESHRTRENLGMLLKWWRSQNGVCDLANFSESDFRRYTHSLISKQRPLGVRVILYSLLRSLPISEPNRDWTWLVNAVRNECAALNRRQGKSSETRVCQFSRGQAPIEPWPTAWQAAYAGFFLPDPVEAILGQHPSSKRKLERSGRHVREGVAAYVRTMRRHGLPVEFSKSNIQVFVLTLMHRCKSTTIGTYLAALLRLARAVHAPIEIGQQIAELRRAFARRERLSPRRKDLLTLPNSMQVFSLARDLMNEARGGRADCHADAQRFQSGLMLLTLCFVPLRAQNFSMLERCHWDFTGWPGRLAVPGEEMKNGRDLDLPLPEELRLACDEYWARWRPVLVGNGSSTRLWVNRGGRILGAEAIRKRLQQLTENRLHVRVSLHDFRDISATTATILLPERPDVASAILGQVSPKSLETYLQISVALSATRQLVKFLEELKKDLRQTKGANKT